MVGFSVDGLFFNPAVTLMCLKPQERYHTWKTPSEATHHQTVNMYTTQIISNQQSSYGCSFALKGGGATAFRVESRDLQTSCLSRGFPAFLFVLFFMSHDSGEDVPRVGLGNDFTLGDDFMPLAWEVLRTTGGHVLRLARRWPSGLQDFGRGSAACFVLCGREG